MNSTQSPWFRSLLRSLVALAIVWKAAAQPAPAKAQTTTVGAIAGRVLDTGGKPIAGATVLIYPRDEPITARFKAQTDVTGRFRVEGVPAATWRLTWSAQGFSEKYDVSGPFPAGIRVPTLINVFPGEAAGVSLVMRKNAVLYGRITDLSGRTVANQDIWLIAGPDTHVQPVHLKVRCDHQGFYRRTFDHGWEGGFGAYVPGRAGYGPFKRIKLEDGVETRIDFRLVRGASVSGTVFAEDGTTPVRGARICCHQPQYATDFPFRVVRMVRNYFPGEGEESPRVEWQGDSVSGPDGKFVLPVNPGVEYVLFADTNTHITRYEGSPVVKLRDGENRTGIRFVLERRYR